MSANRNILDYIRRLSDAISSSAKRMNRRERQWKKHVSDDDFSFSPKAEINWPFLQAMDTRNNLRSERLKVFLDIGKYLEPQYVKDKGGNVYWTPNEGMIEYAPRLDSLIDIDPLNFMDAKSRYVRNRAKRAVLGDE